ncbi:MAG: hypothetical protein JXA89_28750 [Anaerolineae bacterium]|nr:hypothetical protein [Anaerolineae bacterium]
MRKMENANQQASRSALSYACVCLTDPPAIAAIGLLLLNDHVLKAAVPSWWTGKLSDLAGLYFSPFCCLFSWVCWRQRLADVFAPPIVR